MIFHFLVFSSVLFTYSLSSCGGWILLSFLFRVK